MFIHSQNAFTKRLNAHNILTCMIYANVVMSLLLNIRENIHNRHYSYSAYHVFDLHPEVDTICSLSVFVSVSDTICVRIRVREKITICIRIEVYSFVSDPFSSLGQLSDHTGSVGGVSYAWLLCLHVKIEQNGTYPRNRIEIEILLINLPLVWDESECGVSLHCSVLACSWSLWDIQRNKTNFSFVLRTTPASTRERETQPFAHRSC
jgi:hypothetical protein